MKYTTKILLLIIAVNIFLLNVLFAQNNTLKLDVSLPWDSVLDALVYGWGKPTTSTSYGYMVGTNKPLIVLPLEFTQLNGKSLYKANELTWNADDKSKVNHFIVERYSGNNIWTAIDRVEANHEWKYTDYAITGNTSYMYRISAYDKDGRVKTSNVIELFSYQPTWK